MKPESSSCSRNASYINPQNRKIEGRRGLRSSLSPPNTDLPCYGFAGTTKAERAQKESQEKHHVLLPTVALPESHWLSLGTQCEHHISFEVLPAHIPAPVRLAAVPPVLWHSTGYTTMWIFAGVARWYAYWCMHQHNDVFFPKDTTRHLKNVFS